ncbi:MAG: hypothetical protein D6690_09115 [Nitrospirae bacterium]|nr:MAG: hypothetical protein D6690_09115 [Nitrospirota bacterium]
MFDRSRITILGLVLFATMWLVDGNFTQAQTSGPTKSFFSPIIRLEPEKGFFLISTGSGILWVQVEDHVKEHLKTLAKGDMIDVVVEFRPNNLPPLLKSWKLARSESPCKIFDGKTCRTK